MSETPLDSLTDLLSAARSGDAQAHQALFAQLYRELKQLARGKLYAQGDAHVMSATTLVHETYLKLIQSGRLRAESRAQFFALAGQTMRSIIIDEARGRLAAKRGHGRTVLSLDTAIDTPLASNALGDEDLLTLNAALDRLAAADARLARVVELKYFAGLTIEEIAEALESSERTVKRHWQAARSFLLASLQEPHA